MEADKTLIVTDILYSCVDEVLLILYKTYVSIKITVYYHTVLVQIALNQVHTVAEQFKSQLLVEADYLWACFFLPDNTVASS